MNTVICIRTNTQIIEHIHIYTLLLTITTKLPPKYTFTNFFVLYNSINNTCKIKTTFTFTLTIKTHLFQYYNTHVSLHLQRKQITVTITKIVLIKNNILSYIHGFT